MSLGLITEAVILAVPFPTTVTTPVSSLTVTTSVLLLLNATVSLEGSVAPVSLSSNV